MVPWNESFSVSALTAQLDREFIDVIAESDGPPSWSLDTSETGDSTKYPWVGVVEGTVGEKNRETVTASLCLVFNGCWRHR